MNDERSFLRQTIATVAYRAGKTVRDAPPEFARYKAGETSRTPLQILSHMGDLYAWAKHLAKGEKYWVDRTPEDWQVEVERFFAELAELDAYLASDAPLLCESGRLFSGPIADSIWHAGQLAMLRRMSGAPIRGENFFVAQIEIGRVGLDQAAPKREFD